MIVIPCYSSDLELPGDVWKEVEYNGRIINKLSNTRKKKSLSCGKKRNAMS